MNVWEVMEGVNMPALTLLVASSAHVSLALNLMAMV